MRFAALLTTFVALCGISTAAPTAPAVAGSQLETISAEHGLERRNPPGPRFLWRRDGRKISIRLLAVVKPPTQFPGGIYDSLRSTPDFAAAFSETVRRELQLRIPPANSWFATMWDAFRVRLTPPWSSGWTVGMDIQTELPANVNPNAFSDQALVDNVQAMFSHFGITNVQAVQDQALPLPAKKRRDVALEGRQLGSGAKQFCLNPSTEIFGLIDTSKETSNNLNQGTACPFG